MEGHWYPCLGRLPLNLATMRPECRELWTLRPVFQKCGPAGGRVDRAPLPAGRPGGGGRRPAPGERPRRKVAARTAPIIVHRRTPVPMNARRGTQRGTLSPVSVAAVRL